MSRSFPMKTAVLAFLVAGSTALAAMVSTPKNVSAVFEDRGYRLVPVSEVYIAGDESTGKVYEIIRHGNERITLGRLHTSCTCIQLEAAKSTFEAGERAFVTLRNIRPTPAAGQHYAFYVQVTSPIRTTLRADLFLQSNRFRQSQPSGINAYAMQSTPQYAPQYQQPYQNQYPQGGQYQYAQPQQPSAARTAPAQPFQPSSRLSYRR